MDTIRILLVDDQSIILDGLDALITEDERFIVVGRAVNGREAMERALELVPDVVVMDISMPEVDGIEATKAIRSSRKLAKAEVRVLVLSMYNNKEFVDELFEAGASGYLLKNTGREELKEALLTVAGGGRYVAAQVQRTLDEVNAARRQGDIGRYLTRREKEIVRLLAADRTNHEIAEQLHLSVQTVETHKKNIYFKLGIHSSGALVTYAMERGW
jgi:two-component system nitrate/nitrite response regulator NarL